VTALEDSRVLAVRRDIILEAFERDAGFAARFYRALAVFLSDRLRSATAHDGAGDELDEGILDTLHQAGDRFVRLVAMLDGRER
jgi:CRP-like cAMP-binding protein